MTNSLFRKEALDHQRERLWGDVVLTQPLSTRFLTFGLLFVVAMLIAFLVFSTYTRKETVTGYLKPQGGLVQVYPSQPGQITEIFVDTGAVVKKGDQLMRIDTDRTLDDGTNLGSVVTELLDQQRNQLEARIERQLEQKENRRRYLEGSTSGLRDQIAQMERQLSLQKERVALMKNRYSALAELRRDQLISEEEFQSRYQGYLDSRQEQERLQQSMIAERARLNDAEFELASLDTNVQEAIDQLRAEISSLDQRIAQQTGDSGFIIRAPADGRISSMQASLGNRVLAQRPLMAILPQGAELQAELLVPTQAIAFVKPGLEVDIRYHAFPYERFGMHASEITEVAHNVLSPQELDAPVQVQGPVYLVTAALDSQVVTAYGQSMPLQAGMTLEADIRLDERPLYQWLLRPLLSLEGTL